jgi:hypothetical protein
MTDRDCAHLGHFAHPRRQAVHPGSAGCEECLASGDDWVHLRLCMTCGHVGCCDDSPNRHATKHFHFSSHPVIKSYEPGEEWAWCYVHEVALDAIPSFLEESPRHHIGSPSERF